MFDVRDYGAAGDGKTLNTEAVQQAIDACNAAGGGTVSVAGGSFVTGTIYLKSHVVLRVEAGATLLGSPNIADYATDTHKNMYKNEPHMDRCLIFARDAEGIGIEGAGTIDGQGQFFPNSGDSESADPEKNRPMMIRFLRCRGIRVRDITLVRPAAWTSAWLYCEDIVVDGITIHSRANGNGDGLDFDGCRDVRVSNSSFNTSDDSICLQSSRTDQPVDGVTVTNCVFESRWAGLRIGLLAVGDIRHVTVTGCVFRTIQDSGLKIQAGEGGELSHMVFSDLVMHAVPRPVFLTLCDVQACVDKPDTGRRSRIRGMVFRNIYADSTTVPSGSPKDSGLIFMGLPDLQVEDITVSGVTLRAAGGGTDADAAGSLPHFTEERLAGWWPEYHRFERTVPASGLYAANVDGLRLSELDFTTAAADARPPVVARDCRVVSASGSAGT